MIKNYLVEDIKPKGLLVDDIKSKGYLAEDIKPKNLVTENVDDVVVYLSSGQSIGPGWYMYVTYPQTILIYP